MKALIIYSGGMDSTVLLHECKGDIKMAVTFAYGSKHQEREVDCAIKNCLALDIPHKVITLDFFKYFKSSLLKGNGDIPKESYSESNMSSTVVPFRNAIMLSIAVGIAESNGLDAVLIANHGGDHDIYPDCRGEFIRAMQETAKAGTYAGVNIVSPYCELSKRDIAIRGQELGVDFSMTYSCYNGGKYHCGECATCIERKEALQGFDNTIYLK